MKAKQPILISLLLLGVGLVVLVLVFLFMEDDQHVEVHVKKIPGQTAPIAPEKKPPTGSPPIVEEPSKASPSTADEETWPLPPLEKRMEEYKDLGILDVKCGLDDACFGEWGEYYSLASLFTKETWWLSPVKMRGVAIKSGSICAPQMNNTEYLKARSLETAQNHGYSSLGEWCSRLAQMYCDLGPSGRLNIKGAIDSEDNYMFYQEQAAKYLTVEGHASCVDDKLKQIMIQKFKR